MPSCLFNITSNYAAGLILHCSDSPKIDMKSAYACDPVIYPLIFDHLKSALLFLSYFYFHICNLELFYSNSA